MEPRLPDFQTTRLSTAGTSGQAKLTVDLEGGSTSGMKLQMTISDGENIVFSSQRETTAEALFTAPGSKKADRSPEVSTQN